MKPSMEKLVKSELPDADYPDFDPGDTIRVTTREEIGGTMRTRMFEGVCISRKGEGPNQTFKVRKVSFGVGVERIFPLYSPIIEEIEVIRRGKVRRAKLNYLEGLSTKKARIKERDYRPEVEDQLDTEAVPDEQFDEEIREAEPTPEPETASESDAGDEDEQASDGEETGEKKETEKD